MNERQRQTLAALIHELRPDWDIRGVIAALDDIRISKERVADVALASIRAATDTNAKTPGVIPTAGPHWEERTMPPLLLQPPLFPGVGSPLTDAERAAASDAKAAAIAELHRIREAANS